MGPEVSGAGVARWIAADVLMCATSAAGQRPSTELWPRPRWRSATRR